MKDHIHAAITNTREQDTFTYLKQHKESCYISNVILTVSCSLALGDGRTYAALPTRVNIMVASQRRVCLVVCSSSSVQKRCFFVQVRTQQINNLVTSIYFDYVVLTRSCSGKRVGEQHDPPRAAHVTFSLSLSFLMFRQRCQVVEHSIFSQNSLSDDDDDNDARNFVFFNFWLFQDVFLILL